MSQGSQTHPELYAPPYPRGLCTLDQLFAHVFELRAWLAFHEDRLEGYPKAFVAQTEIPDMGELAMMRAAPLQQLYTVLVKMKAIREAWDLLSREYEYSAHMFRGQLAGLIDQAKSLVKLAFTTPSEFMATQRHLDQAKERQSIKQLEEIRRQHEEAGQPLPPAIERMFKAIDEQPAQD